MQWEWGPGIAETRQTQSGSAATETVKRRIGETENNPRSLRACWAIAVQRRVWQR